MIYTKELANLYDKLFGHIAGDYEFYKHFIEQNNGPALETGSGTGRLLLKYLQQNLNVQGIEPSNDMTQICLQKAKLLNLNPVIYEQSLEEISLDKKYKTIYMPLYVFQNIIEQDSIISSLKKCYEYLEQNGQILISIFFPCNDANLEQIYRITKKVNYERNTIVLSELADYDNFNQIETKTIKHEIFSNNILTKTYLSEIKFRFYSKYELLLLLENTGFKNIQVFGDYTLQEADSSNNAFIFSAYKTN